MQGRPVRPITECFRIGRRGQIVDDLRADGSGVLRRGPVVVLVNEYSASAAELVGYLPQSGRISRWLRFTRVAQV